MVNYPVLVLNQSYEPLTICRARRALVLLNRGKAEMLEDGVGYIHTVAETFPLPSVIRLDFPVRRPRRERKLIRTEIFNRDRYTCQYCGKETRQLTLDHVVPRYRGGQHTWENVVAACATCNRRKAGRTPKEAGMKLLNTPSQPKDRHFFIPYHFREARVEWGKYLFQ